MSISEPDALIGAIALESVLSKLSPHAEDLADFRGAFHVLSGFTADRSVSARDMTTATKASNTNCSGDALSRARPIPSVI